LAWSSDAARAARRLLVLAAVVALGGGVVALAAAPAPAPASSPPGVIAGSLSLVRLSVGSAVKGFDETLVYLDDAPPAAAGSAGPFVMAQEKKAFTPRLLVVPNGARVDFPNRDVFFHNVFSVTPGSTFDLGLYKSGGSKSVVFATPGIVSVYCNIHPQMSAWVAVMANALWARPAADGSFVLAGVPAGKWHAVAWFPYGKPERAEVSVAAGGRAALSLVLREVVGAVRHPDKDGKAYGRY
jgi:plastocyanin